jgi:hypothetical protein
MIGGAVQIFSDPLLRKVFHAADVELLPTARGKFSARLTQIRLNRVWMQRADESLPRVLLGTVSPERAIIGFLTDAKQSQTFDGLSKSALACSPLAGSYRASIRKIASHLSRGLASRLY